MRIDQGTRVKHPQDSIAELIISLKPKDLNNKVKRVGE